MSSQTLLSANKASLFMEELLNSVEALTPIAEVYGVQTLVDLMYLQHAILDGGFIDCYSDESSVLEIVNNLPSANMWSRYIKIEYMDSPIDKALSPQNSNDSIQNEPETIADRLLDSDEYMGDEAIPRVAYDAVDTIASLNSKLDHAIGVTSILYHALDDASSVVDKGADEDYAYQSELEAGATLLGLERNKIGPRP